MSKQLSKQQLGMQWDGTSRAIPAHTQTEKDRYLAIVSKLYELSAIGARETGGIDAWVARMDRPPSYSSKVSEALNRRDDRHLQLEHLAGLLVEPKFADLLREYLNELGTQQQLTREQIAETNLEIETEMPEHQKRARRAEIARRRGVRPEDVKL